MTDDWPAFERDVRRAAEARGWPEHVTAALLADLRPAFVALNRARLHGVDSELGWALIGLCADRQRRKAHEMKTRALV